MAIATSFHLTIISPAAVLVDAPVPLVQIPGVEGDFGVLPGHSPLFSMIRPGVIRVTMAEGAPRQFFATAGYADVTPDRCTVISDQIRELSTISGAEAEEALVAARTALAKAETPAERQQAENQLAAAEALSSALKAH